MTDPVLCSVAEGVAHVTLNRPEAGNAIDLPMARALLAVAIACENDPAIRCVVVTGKGKLFCAGGDLALMSEAGAARRCPRCWPSSSPPSTPPLHGWPGCASRC